MKFNIIYFGCYSKKVGSGLLISAIIYKMNKINVKLLRAAYYLLSINSYMTCYVVYFVFSHIRYSYL